MTSIKPFQMEDLFELNPVNLDPLTENFNVSFYSQYLIEWPQLFYKSVETPNGQASGYMMAKQKVNYRKRMAYAYHCGNSSGPIP